jgi:hypothetical protein
MKQSYEEELFPAALAPPALERLRYSETRVCGVMPSYAIACDLSSMLPRMLARS